MIRITQSKPFASSLMLVARGAKLPFLGVLCLLHALGFGEKMPK